VRHERAKETAPTTKPLRLSELTGRASQLASHLLNSIALARYGESCTVDALAKTFDTTPGLLRQTLVKMEEGGLITVRGSLYQTVYPTVKMLVEQDPKLTQTDARELIRKLERE
jgi:hypothetical protein